MSRLDKNEQSRKFHLNNNFCICKSRIEIHSHKKRPAGCARITLRILRNLMLNNSDWFCLYALVKHQRIRSFITCYKISKWGEEQRGAIQNDYITVSAVDTRHGHLVD